MLNALLIVLAIGSLVQAVRLHYSLKDARIPRFYVCPGSRKDMFRAAHGAIFLVVGYLLLEIRWILYHLSDQIPATDDLGWTALEAGFLTYIGWTCTMARKLMHTEWGRCALKEDD